MKDFKKLEEIWAAYVYEGRMDPSVQPAVAECWKKCRDAGVDPNGGLGRRVDDAVFQSIREANSTLIDTALPIMQSIFDIVRRTGFLMVLTDSAGYVLETMGDESIMERTEDLRFVPGALWSNLSVGTNAISVALDCDTPIQMVGPEHYCRTHHGWTCSAAPIHGENGEIVGCLNMSGEAADVHDHTLAVVLSAAIGIEGKLSLLHSAELMRSALEGSADSILLLGENLRPVWANSAAGELLGLDGGQIGGLDVRALLPDLDWNARPWRREGGFYADDLRVATAEGIVRCSAAITSASALGTPTLNVVLKRQKHLIASVNKLSGNRALYTFDDIFAADPEMKKDRLPGRALRALRRQHPHRGRERHGQGAHRPGHPQRRQPRLRPPSWPSTAPRCTGTCWTPSSSATNPAPCPARPPAGAAPANSSSPTAAPSSLTRSAPCRWSSSPSCCARWRRTASPASAGSRRWSSTSASSPPPTGGWASWPPPAASGMTSITA